MLLNSALENIIKASPVLLLNRAKGRFKLTIGQQDFEQTICEFLLTFGFLQDKDVEEYLLNSASRFDHVCIPLSGCGRNITLDLSDFISLRAVYASKMFELKLEDMLMRRGVVLPD